MGQRKPRHNNFPTRDIDESSKPTDRLFYSSPLPEIVPIDPIHPDVVQVQIPTTIDDKREICHSGADRVPPDISCDVVSTVKVLRPDSNPLPSGGVQRD